MTYAPYTRRRIIAGHTWLGWLNVLLLRFGLVLQEYGCKRRGPYEPAEHIAWQFGRVSAATPLITADRPCPICGGTA